MLLDLTREEVALLKRLILAEDSHLGDTHLDSDDASMSVVDSLLVKFQDALDEIGLNSNSYTE
jgi:hypothetical protein